MRKFSALGVVGAGAGCSRCGECVGLMQSVWWVRGLGAVGAVSA